MDEDLLAEMRRWLVGTGCTSTESPNGMPFIRFGLFSLWIPSPWRITGNSHISASSDSDYVKLAEELSAALAGQKIQSVDIRGPFHDLDICFENDLHLETFSDSEAHENWNL